ncbi:MAG: MBL fold metallo-hydrolase [Deltaproteobacteria bacterium]|jgi:phosphoribosyl 1,2-cyclic phosphodiesterase|nr:MBL fold metallo-hydrolase [Deltaproteobacteria bacterium]
MKNRNTFSVCMLASGSKGNSTYVSDGSTSILVDAGLSGIEIERRLQSKEIDPNHIDAVLVSHEHTDHIGGVGVLSRRFNLPVFISRKTETAAISRIGTIAQKEYFEQGSQFTIKTLTIHPFSTSHDAVDSSGFTLSSNGTKIGIATDLGIATRMVKEHLKGCSLIILEANHDTDMLVNGPYPWHLKQRIKSRTGHLSNSEAKNLLKDIICNDLRYVILAHLSETNNHPEKALNIVSEATKGYKAQLTVARQDDGCQVFILDK